MVYKDALKRIGGQKTGDRDLAHRILCWIVESKRPLTRQEFQHALAINVGKDKFQEDYIIHDIDSAVTLCAGLVILSSRSNTVQLMHHTTRIYFEDPKHRPEFMNTAHETIASSCITYVSYSEFGHGPSQDDDEFEIRIERYPFLRYAAQYWGIHLQSHQPNPRSIEDMALEYLQNVAKTESSNQARETSLHTYPGYSQDYTQFISGLHTAAYFGLSNLVGRLIELGADILARDENRRTALHGAAESGHYEVVQMLLRHGAQTNVLEANYGQTPLHLAALNGHSKVVKILLDNGAIPNLTDEDGWMPIHVGAWTGNDEVVRILLENVDVNEAGKDGLTALHCAAAQGHIKVAQLLINKKADVNATDKDGWTPLLWASQKRHDIMNLRTISLREEASALLQQFAAKQEEIMESLQLQVQAIEEGVVEVLQQHVLTTEDRFIEEPLAFWQARLTWVHPGFQVNVPNQVFENSTRLVNQFLGVRTLGTSFLEIAGIRPRSTPRNETTKKKEIENGKKRKTEPGATDKGKNRKQGRNKDTKQDEKQSRAEELDEETEFANFARTAGNAVNEKTGEKDPKLKKRKQEPPAPVRFIFAIQDELTALRCGIECGHEPVARLLIENGADVKRTCKVEVETETPVKMEVTPTALHLAAFSGHEPMVN